MQETTRRTRHRPMRRAQKAKEKWTQRLMIQFIVSVLIFAAVGLACYNKVLIEQRQTLRMLLIKSTDTQLLMSNAKKISEKNLYLTKVWNYLSPNLPIESPIETKNLSSAGQSSLIKTDEEWSPVTKKLEDFFLPPLIGEITSNYGDRVDPFESVDRFHHGIDIAANAGDAIMATSDGEVIFSGEISGYGNTVKILHPNGYISLYAHCQALQVGKGDRVEAGQRIALAGSTGRSTGVHLHFEIIIDNQRVDPKTVVSFTKSATM